MTDAELDDLERLCNAASPEPWEIFNSTDGNCIERFSLAVVGAKIDTVCTLEEDEPGDFDEDAREGILANFAFIKAARTAIPALIAEVRRLRADQPFVVG